MIIGIALAAARRSLDTTVKSTDQLTALTAGTPVIGTIPFSTTARKHTLAANSDIAQRTLEAYRKIRINLQFINIAAPGKVLLFTSPLPDEGKTSVVCNLAIVLAQFGQRIVVVETDLRQPGAASYLGLPRTLGVTDVLTGKVDADEAIQTWDNAPFDILDSGPTPPNPSDLLGSERMNDLIKQLRQRYEMVLLDAPPVLPFADVAATAPASDGAILVVRYGKTRIAQVQQATEALSAVGTPLLGSVLTMTPVRQRGEYGHGHSEYRPADDDPRLQRINERQDQSRTGGSA